MFDGKSDCFLRIEIQIEEIASLRPQRFEIQFEFVSLTTVSHSIERRLAKQSFDCSWIKIIHEQLAFSLCLTKIRFKFKSKRFKLCVSFHYFFSLFASNLKQTMVIKSNCTESLISRHIAKLGHQVLSFLLLIQECLNVVCESTSMRHTQNDCRYFNQSFIIIVTIRIKIDNKSSLRKDL